MTKCFRVFLSLLLLMTASAAKGSTLYYVVDGIRYAANTVGNTAQVVSYGSYKSMTEINIPASITADGVSYKVTKLGDICFEGCTSLTSINIPNSVTDLGYCCFKGCDNLASVYCLATTPPILDNRYIVGYKYEWPFENKASKTLYVPEESVDAYKSAIVWKDFGKIRSINATGIKAVDMDKIDIAVEDGNFKLCNVPANEPVSVYSTSGELLGSGKGNISVRALSGQAVILKVGTWSRKVLVK